MKKLKTIITTILMALLLNGCGLNKTVVTESGAKVPDTYKNVYDALKVTKSFRANILYTTNVLWEKGIITREDVAALGKLDGELLPHLTVLTAKMALWYNYIEEGKSIDEIKKDALISLSTIVINSNELFNYLKPILEL